MNKEKVVIGLSGGVDSAVAAYLLKEQGYEVIGATMQIWEDEVKEDGVSGIAAVDDAKEVAALLDIPHYILNFKKEFNENVVDYFVNEYMNGRTPNPCVVCNRHVKFQALMDRGQALGASYIATGHYANIKKHPTTGRYTLTMSDAKAKDQTYVLYNLTQDQLSRTLMPLGKYTKDKIREMAVEIGLEVANKPDSMEICFIPDDDYGRFIEEKTGKNIKVGNFIDMNGKILGKHKGIIHYTVGQRKGLGIALGKPMFVYEIKPDTNEVVLCENVSLFKTTVYANQVNFMSYGSIEGEMRGEAKIRYNHKKAPCTVTQLDDETIQCIFDEPQRAITPGQSLVVYDGDYVVCGGTIFNK